MLSSPYIRMRLTSEEAGISGSDATLRLGQQSRQPGDKDSPTRSQPVPAGPRGEALLSEEGHQRKARRGGGLVPNPTGERTPTARCRSVKRACPVGKPLLPSHTAALHFLHSIGLAITTTGRRGGFWACNVCTFEICPPGSGCTSTAFGGCSWWAWVSLVLGSCKGTVATGGRTSLGHDPRFGGCKFNTDASDFVSNFL